MHDTGKGEDYGPGHLTFDCPWCGAISGIKPELVGEHFECAECKKSTKLTEENTRHAHIYDAPRDAPHHDDAARPFVCPWCGHDEAIPPTHMGEYHDCPKCHKRTKLTERSLPSQEALDAQAKEKEKEEHHASWPLGLAAVIVLAAVLWAVFGGGGDEGDERAGTPENGDDPAVTEVTDVGDEQPETPEPTTPEPATTPVEEETTSLTVRIAEARYEKAQALTAGAKAALDAWLAENEGVARAVEIQSVREALHGRAQKLLAAVDAGAIRPDDVRTFNEKLKTYVGEDPARIALAQALLTELAKQPVRPPRAGSWEQLNFHAPRLREVLEDQIRIGRAEIPDEYMALESEWTRNAEAEAEAREALEVAKAE